MQNADPLSQLRDIHLPAELGWWPLAYGWWLLIALCILTTALIIWFFIRRHHANKYRKVAITELTQAYTTHADDPITFTATASTILKRAAQHRFGVDTAQLFGESWKNFLLAHADLTNTAAIDNICFEQYKPAASIDSKQTFEGAKHWLLRHK